MKKSIVIATVLCLCFGVLTGCQATATPTQTVTSYLDALKAQDADAQAKVYSGDTSGSQNNLFGDGSEQDEMTKALNESMLPKLLDFDYKLSNEQINGDSATVDVTITTYPLGTAVSTMMSNYLAQAFSLAFSGATEEQMSSLATSLLTDQINSIEKSYSKTATLSLTKVEGKWMVDDVSSNKEFEDAFTGGLVSTLEAYSALGNSGNADNAA